MPTSDSITLNRLATILARQEATDLHLAIGSPPVIRKDGVLLVMENEPVVTQAFLERAADFLTGEKEKKILNEDKEAVLIHTFNKVMRFRVHIYKQKGLLGISLRYIPLFYKKARELGLPPYLEKTLRTDSGLILVAGIHDSGRSTTVASLINTLNELGPPRYITTIESPIERLYANNKCIIDQLEVGKDVSSYLHGLKRAQTDDIDVIVLDAIFDGASVRSMLEALESGATVIAILNAPSAVDAVSKVLSYIEPIESIRSRSVFAKHLLCVIAQRLVHKIGGGRTLAYEFLPNKEIVPKVLASGTIDQLSHILRNMIGFDATTIEKSLASLVQSGTIRLEDALLEAPDPNFLKELLR